MMVQVKEVTKENFFDLLALHAILAIGENKLINFIDENMMNGYINEIEATRIKERIRELAKGGEDGFNT